MQSTRRIPFVLVVLATGIPMFMATLDNLVITNALPVIHAELGASVEELQWFINAYTLVFASLILLTVGLGDRLGRRTIFIAGIAIFTIASVFAALSTDPTQLIVARAIQGIGGAGIMPLSLSLLSGAVESKRRPLAIGIWGGLAGLGVAVGPLLGGAIVEGLNWQSIFWINVPVGILAIPFVLWVLPNAFGARVRLDIPGVVLAGLGVLGIVFGIVRGNDAGWDSFEVLGSLIGGAALHRRVLWLGEPDGVAAAAAAAVPRSQLLDRERGRIRIQLRDVRSGLHPDPVPAGRSGRVPARGRDPDHAVDARADDHRPDRGHHHAARRHPPPDRHRPHAAGRRTVLARGDDVGRRAVHDDAARRSSPPGSGCRWCSPRRRPRCSPTSPRTTRRRAPAPTRPSARSASRSGSPC